MILHGIGDEVQSCVHIALARKINVVVVFLLRCLSFSSEKV